MRKFKLFFLALAMVAVVNVSQAQDEIQDESLRRYALLSEVVDAMKQEIKNLTVAMVENQEGIDGKRFNELNKTKGDAAKMEAAGATEFEKKFMALVKKKKDERTTAIQDVVKIMASKMFSGGGAEYKKVKAAIKSDEAVKARYEAIVSKMKAEEEGA